MVTKNHTKYIRQLEQKKYRRREGLFVAEGTKVVGTFEEFEVTKLVMDEQGKSASVSFVVYEPDTYVPARVDLVFENGRWVIDNFHNLKYMIDVRSAMWNYVAHPYII